MAISGSYAEGDEVIYKDCDLQVDLTPVSASSFADISTWGTEVSVSGGDLPTTQFYAFQSGGPIIFEGNRNPFRITVTVLYTEGAGDPFPNIWDKHEDPAGNYASDLSAMNVQWSPGGADTGDNVFTTSGGKLVDCPPPQGNAEGTDPTQFTFVIEAGTIARTTAA